jgi:adenosylcobinamide-phosphate synthase
MATLALVVDRAGEPPAELHPTVWMGRWIGAGRTARLSRRPAASLAEGALVVGSGLLVTTIVAAMVAEALARLPRRLRPIAEAAALKPALALRALVDAARAVERALIAGDIEHARDALARHLVSRDTRSLSAAEVAGAAIESIAENLGDSVIAPLLAYRVAGLPGAYAYRFANTADAMLGYRTPELEWFGKPAARLDDVLNLIPARVAALCIAAAAPAGNGSARDALRCGLRDARRTPSPNAGWPMAAMAGALGVRLTKRDGRGGHLYALNARGGEPLVADVRRARLIVVRAAWLAATFIDASEPSRCLTR